MIEYSTELEKKCSNIKLMGLLALLVTIVIIILLMVFSNISLSPFNHSSSNPKNIENKAKDAVDSTNERLKFEQDQRKNLDLP